MDISIIIPVYNALVLARACVASIFEHGSPLNFEVIVVDNGSAADVRLWAEEQCATHSNVRYLRYDEPLGFAKSVNAGADAAKGDVLIVLNSDTIVTAGWMDALHDALVADPSLGAISPYTNHAGEPAQMDFGTVGMPAAKALARVAERRNKANIFYLPQRITFFCVAVRSEVWRAFEGLDEAYQVGNFEDDDLCLRLRMAGYRLAVAQHAYVYHHNNATFSANKISHGGWMTRNAATFAEHARHYAEADPTVLDQARRWPRRSLSEIAVVILAGEGSIDRTLRSLANQTVVDFEVVLPGSGKQPTRTWITYLTQGDIFYPFHLEALHDALERNGQEAIYSDPWIAGAKSAKPHPDVSRHIRKSPLLIAGWMHHTSLHPPELYEETVPMHWPRLTWEMLHAPAVGATKPSLRERIPTPVEAARTLYRKLLPLETRLGLDRRVRRLVGRPLPDLDVKRMQLLAEHLEKMTAEGVDRGRFAAEGSLPAVFMFNAVAWNSITQRQHHFARGLAELGHPVFWVEPVIMPARNWWSNRPLVQLAPGVHQLRLPGPSRDVYVLQWNDAIVAAMMAAIAQTCSAYDVQHAVSLVNYPRWQPLLKRLRELRGWRIASDCLDDQRALAGMYQTTLFSYEDWLVEHADLLLTSSVVLQETLHTRPSTVLHNACDYEVFASAVPMGSFADRPHPIVGFFGALADWLDMDLIRQAALRYPRWTFVYIGPHTFSHTAVEVEWLRAIDLPNIVVHPQMDLRALAAHLVEFDVCIMPFQDIPATRSMNPVKLYEYAAAGKPTIARDLPEVRHLVESEARGLIELYRTPQEFFGLLEKAAAEDDPQLRERRRAFAHRNDWNHRVAELSSMLLAMEERKARGLSDMSATV